MQLLSHLEQLIFNLFLLSLIIGGLSLLNSSNKNQTQATVRKQRQPVYRSYHLACLLEDAPPSSLKGQAYELAIPLMTPLACIVPQTWHHYYQQNLAKSGINYWQWRDKPESYLVCPALTCLFGLSEPQGYAKEILEALGDRTNPFFHPLWDNKKARVGNIFNPKQDFNQKGKFADREFRVQIAMRQAFRQWHLAAYQKLGSLKLISVYQRCYGVSWDDIQQMIRLSKTSFPAIILDHSSAWWEVLGVSLFTKSEQVEKTYKTMMRLWHPDRNSHPNATEVTIRLNLAYQQYQALPRLALRKWLSNES